MRRIKAGLLAMLLATILSGASRAESLTFHLTNESDALDLAVEFYSVGTDRAWPGGDDVYVLEYVEGEGTYRLDCIAGEKICVGAWDYDGFEPEVYWGVGRNGTEGCEGCCAICDGGESSQTFNQ